MPRQPSNKAKPEVTGLSVDDAPVAVILASCQSGLVCDSHVSNIPTGGVQGRYIDGNLGLW